MVASARRIGVVAGSVIVLVAGTTSTASAATSRPDAKTPAPVVSSVSPAYGSPRGGAKITVRGSNFVDVRKVTFGSRPASHVSTLSSHKLQVTVPSHSAGTEDVRVTTKSGRSKAVTADKYVFVGSPKIISLSTTRGGKRGGTKVTVTGSAFYGVTAVTFDGTRGTKVHVTSPTSLQVTTPSHSAGLVDVGVTTKYGSVVRSNAYGYRASWSDSFDAIDPAQGDLSQVSCGDTLCLAYDLYNNVYIRSAPGHQWQGPTQPDAQQILSLSCASDTLCMIGDTAGRVLIYNGTTWTPVPVDQDQDSNVLGEGVTSVSCAKGTTVCAAGFPSGYLVTTTDGGQTWSPATFQTTGGAFPAALSCGSAGQCAAVDENNVAYFWDGTSWSSEGTVESPSTAQINAIACGAAPSCVAVDTVGNALTYDGTSWTATVVNPDDPTDIRAIDCTSSGCVAADDNGESYTSAPTTGTPSWTDAGPVVSQYDYVPSLSCNASFCTAIDQNSNAADFDRSSSSSAWGTPVQMVVPHTGLYGLSCAPDGSVCAATDSGQYAFVRSGGQWTPTPVALVSGDGFNGVSCTNGAFCMAVTDEGYAVTWTPTKGWSTPTSVANYFDAVSCVSSSFCLATDSGSSYEWNGTTWGPALTVPTGSGDTQNLSCATTTFCVDALSDGTWSTFDGTSWHYHASSDGSGNPRGLSCRSSTSCVLLDGVNDQAVTFDGHSWVGTPLTGAGELESVSCPTTSFCAAVDNGGSVFTGYGSHWSSQYVDSDPFAAISCSTEFSCVAADSYGRVVSYS